MRAVLLEGGEVRLPPFLKRLGAQAGPARGVSLPEDRRRRRRRRGSWVLAIELSPPDLANTEWAFATMGVRDGDPLRGVTDRALVGLEEFTP